MVLFTRWFSARNLCSFDFFNPRGSGMVTPHAARSNNVFRPFGPPPTICELSCLSSPWLAFCKFFFNGDFAELTLVFKFPRPPLFFPEKDAPCAPSFSRPSADSDTLFSQPLKPISIPVPFEGTPISFFFHCQGPSISLFDIETGIRLFLDGQREQTFFFSPIRLCRTLSSASAPPRHSYSHFSSMTLPLLFRSSIPPSQAPFSRGRLFPKCACNHLFHPFFFLPNVPMTLSG